VKRGQEEYMRGQGEMLQLEAAATIRRSRQSTVGSRKQAQKSMQQLFVQLKLLLPQSTATATSTTQLQSLSLCRS